MRIVYILLLSLVAGNVCSQSQKNTIRWQSADTISKLMQTAPKPVLVDIYTDWCHYCHLMDSTTYKNDTVINLINKDYYSFRLNAESQNDIAWMGKVYHYLPQYKIHELAVFLTSGNIVYPSTVLFSKSQPLKSAGGYLSVAEIMNMLK